MSTFMTHQEIFNKVYVGLLKQGKKSMGCVANFSTGVAICAYRGENNTKCALGLLILDEHYNPGCENSTVQGEGPHARILVRSLVASGVNAEDKETNQFLYFLQHIHDNKKVEEWKTELGRFAERYSLTIPEIV